MRYEVDFTAYLKRDLAHYLGSLIILTSDAWAFFYFSSIVVTEISSSESLTHEPSLDPGSNQLPISFKDKLRRRSVWILHLRLRILHNHGVSF